MKASVDLRRIFNVFNEQKRSSTKWLTSLWFGKTIQNCDILHNWSTWDSIDYNVGALCLFVFYSQCIMRHPFIINNAQSKYYTHGLTKRPQQKYSNLFLVTGAFWITLCSKRSLWPKLHIACMINKYLQSPNLFWLKVFLNWLWFANNEPYT